MESEEEPSLSTIHVQANKREVPPTRNRGNPRRNSVVTVEQSHHIQEVNVWKRKPHATNMAKKDTTAVHADLMAQLSKSMRYKHNHQQHSTRTAFPMSTQQCISTLMSTPSRLHLSRA